MLLPGCLQPREQTEPLPPWLMLTFIIVSQKFAAVQTLGHLEGINIYSIQVRG